MRAARAARALGGVDPSDPAADAQSFGAWLAKHGQDDRALRRLWDLVALPTLNVRVEQASLALAAFVFQTGLLADAGAGDIGFHVRPLGELIGEPALRALRNSRVEVLLGRRAEGLEALGGGFRVALADGSVVDGDAVIVAVPHRRAAELLPRGLEDVAARLRKLESSPIVNLHVVYDTPVSDLPFAASVETPVQYVFDRSSAVGLERGRYLAVSLSGADREMEMDVEELRAKLPPRARRALPPRASCTRGALSRDA